MKVSRSIAALNSSQSERNEEMKKIQTFLLLSSPLWPASFICSSEDYLSNTNESKYLLLKEMLLRQHHKNTRMECVSQRLT
jgi:hypothetical protein